MTQASRSWKALKGCKGASRGGRAPPSRNGAPTKCTTEEALQSASVASCSEQSELINAVCDTKREDLSRPVDCARARTPVGRDEMRRLPRSGVRHFAGARNSLALPCKTQLAPFVQVKLCLENGPNTRRRPTANAWPLIEPMQEKHQQTE